jgi:erythromycin esterase-like protein
MRLSRLVSCGVFLLSGCESLGGIFHATNIPAFLVRLRRNPSLTAALSEPRPRRFVGVIYAPATERQSHYFDTSPGRQYDAVIHIDRTTAVEPVTTLAR